VNAVEQRAFSSHSSGLGGRDIANTMKLFDQAVRV